MGRHIQHRCKLTHHHREQVRSHSGSVVFFDFVLKTQSPCGSGLAREWAGTFSIDAS
jgi:hypothetical protein